jgi:hypothetical protein
VSPDAKRLLADARGFDAPSAAAAPYAASQHVAAFAADANRAIGPDRWLAAVDTYASPPPPPSRIFDDVSLRTTPSARAAPASLHAAAGAASPQYTAAGNDVSDAAFLAALEARMAQIEVALNVPAGRAISSLVRAVDNKQRPYGELAERAYQQQHVLFGGEMESPGQAADGGFSMAAPRSGLLRGPQVPSDLYPSYPGSDQPPDDSHLRPQSHQPQGHGTFASQPTSTSGRAAGAAVFNNGWSSPTPGVTPPPPPSRSPTVVPQPQVESLQQQPQRQEEDVSEYRDVLYRSPRTAMAENRRLLEERALQHLQRGGAAASTTGGAASLRPISSGTADRTTTAFDESTLAAEIPVGALGSSRLAPLTAATTAPFPLLVRVTLPFLRRIDPLKERLLLHQLHEHSQNFSGGYGTGPQLSSADLAAAATGEAATFVMHLSDLQQTGEELLWHVVAQARVRFPDLMAVPGFEWASAAASQLLLFAIDGDDAAVLGHRAGTADLRDPSVNFLPPFLGGSGTGGSGYTDPTSRHLDEPPPVTVRVQGGSVVRTGAGRAASGAAPYVPEPSARSASGVTQEKTQPQQQGSGESFGGFLHFEHGTPLRAYRPVLRAAARARRHAEVVEGAHTGVPRHRIVSAVAATGTDVAPMAVHALMQRALDATAAGPAGAATAAGLATAGSADLELFVLLREWVPRDEVSVDALSRGVVARL